MPTRSKVKRPLWHRSVVEQRVLDGLLATDGVIQVALLDQDGLATFTAPRHDDTVEGLAYVVGPLDASGTDRITLQGENACVMAERLKGGRVVVLKCKTDANLGKIRSVFTQSITSLNALFV